MTVLFAATELMDFEAVGGVPTVDTTTATRDATNSRSSVRLSVAGSNDVDYLDCAFAEASTIWAHMSIYAAQIVSGFQEFIRVYSGGTHRIGVRLKTSSGDLEVVTWNGASWGVVLTTATSVFSVTTRHLIDLRVVVGNPGTISLYIDGIVVAASSALDLSFGGITGFDKVRLANVRTGSQSYYSEVIIADVNTIGAKIVSAAPDANGAHTAWSGAYTDIDEVSGGSDLISSGVADQRESFSLGTFPALAGAEFIAAVGVGLNGQRDAAGPQNINMFTRIGGTDYDGADRTLGAAETTRQKLWELSPATGVAWTVAEINAAEFGVRSRA